MENQPAPLSKAELQKLKRVAEKKKRINIMSSRRSAEESAGGRSFGLTSYQESTGSFVGGKVRSRTRVSNVSSINNGDISKRGFANKPSTQKSNLNNNKPGLGQAGTGSAKIGIGRRPLGF